MKIKISIILVLYFIPALYAGAQQFNRTISNKDLKTLVGLWTGPVVCTDTLYNNALITLEGKVDISAMGDSIGLVFTNTDKNGNITSEKSSLFIYDNDQMMRIGGVEYEIESAGRRGYNITLVAIRQGYEKYTLMDFRYLIYFGPQYFNMIRQARYVEMDEYFNRSRASYKK